VQIWTVEEGFWIGSEFRQTRFAASNFRDHEVVFSVAPVQHWIWKSGGVPTKIQPYGQLSPAKDAMKRPVT
jgi:hypothetical protein